MWRDPERRRARRSFADHGTSIANDSPGAWARERQKRPTFRQFSWRRRSGAALARASGEGQRLIS
jgi:hypothetical protein